MALLINVDGSVEIITSKKTNGLFSREDIGEILGDKEKNTDPLTLTPNEIMLCKGFEDDRSDANRNMQATKIAGENIYGPVVIANFTELEDTGYIEILAGDACADKNVQKFVDEIKRTYVGRCITDHQYHHLWACAAPALAERLSIDDELEEVITSRDDRYWYIGRTLVFQGIPGYNFKD